MSYFDIILFGYIVNFLGLLFILLCSFVIGTLELILGNREKYAKKMEYISVLNVKIKEIEDKLPPSAIIQDKNYSFYFPYATTIKVVVFLFRSFNIGVVGTILFSLNDKYEFLSHKLTEYESNK